MNIEEHRDKVNLINDIINYICEDLKIKRPNVVELITSSKFSDENKSFGSYIPKQRKIILVIKDRNLADCLRTLVHELKHMSQDDNNTLSSDAGEDGDQYENEANSYSGKMMREIGRLYPQIYTLKFF